MEKAYEEIKLCVANNQHNVSTETLQLCLEALRIVKETKHNGYTNYPTWLLATYIDHTQPVYEHYQKLCKELQESNESYLNIVGILTQTIEAETKLDCMKHELKCVNTIWSSLLNYCSHNLINYREVAESLLD